MMSGEMQYDFGQLVNIVKAMTGNHQVQVGIFGDKTSRAKGVPTNAEVGAVHEFGSFTRKIPARSFLRMPLSNQSKTILAQASKGMKELIAKGQMNLVLQRLGIACENAIQRAFGSRGFGTWAPDKPATIRQKGSSAPLIDTGQLRRSIASRVVSL